MEPFVLQKEEYFTIDHWEKKFPNLSVGFTTKNGGKSKEPFFSLNIGFHVHDDLRTVIDNRQHVAEAINFPIDDWIGAQQTHETRVQKVSMKHRGIGARDYQTSFPCTDGFFTSDQGVLLTLCYADCVPLYFLHPGSGAVAIAHAGWKGTVHGIAEEMVTIFTKEGIAPDDILVVIGPSICEDCYIVDKHVIKLVQNRLEHVERKPYNLISDNQYKLDLKMCNQEILMSAGIRKENISITNLCTSCDNEYFFSHRRDHGKTGRMMSFIGWKEAK